MSQFYSAFRSWLTHDHPFYLTRFKCHFNVRNPVCSGIKRFKCGCAPCARSCSVYQEVDLSEVDLLYLFYFHLCNLYSSAQEGANHFSGSGVYMCHISSHNPVHQCSAL